MRPKLTSLLPLTSIIFIAACMSTVSPGEMRRPVTGGYTNSEFLVTEENIIDKSRPIVFREGTLPSGHQYSYFPDGSGGVDVDGRIASGWSFACRVDKMTDARNCSIKSYDSNVLILFGTSTTPKKVCVIKHDFPGRTGMIRIDDNSAVTTNVDGCVSGRIFSSMLSGSTITTRRVEWPYDRRKDSSGTTSGLRENFQLMKYVRKNIEDVNF